MFPQPRFSRMQRKEGLILISESARNHLVEIGRDDDLGNPRIRNGLRERYIQH